MQPLHKQLACYGSLSLSHEELLTLILQVASDETESRMRLAHFLAQRGLQGLARVEVGELCLTYGFPPELAARLVGLAELSRRLATLSVEMPAIIRHAEEAASLVLPAMSHLDHEQLRVLVFDRHNHLLANLVLYEGTLDGVAARVGEVFRPAITRQAASIIVCHNHPSGCLEPSPEDLSFTRHLLEAGELLDIAVLDHLIIANGAYQSVVRLLLLEQTEEISACDHEQASVAEATLSPWQDADPGTSEKEQQA
jgi:DNA repair protein RadC